MQSIFLMLTCLAAWSLQVTALPQNPTREGFGLYPRASNSSSDPTVVSQDYCLKGLVNGFTQDLWTQLQINNWFVDYTNRYPNLKTSTRFYQDFANSLGYYNFPPCTIPSQGRCVVDSQPPCPASLDQRNGYIYLVAIQHLSNYMVVASDVVKQAQLDITALLPDIIKALDTPLRNWQPPAGAAKQESNGDIKFADVYKVFSVAIGLIPEVGPMFQTATKTFKSFLEPYENAYDVLKTLDPNVQRWVESGSSIGGQASKTNWGSSADQTFDIGRLGGFLVDIMNGWQTTLKSSLSSTLNTAPLDDGGLYNILHDGRFLPIPAEDVTNKQSSEVLSKGSFTEFVIKLLIGKTLNSQNIFLSYDGSSYKPVWWKKGDRYIAARWSKNWHPADSYSYPTWSEVENYPVDTTKNPIIQVGAYQIQWKEIFDSSMQCQKSNSVNTFGGYFPTSTAGLWPEVRMSSGASVSNTDGSSNLPNLCVFSLPVADTTDAGLTKACQAASWWLCDGKETPAASGSRAIQYGLDSFVANQMGLNGDKVTPIGTAKTFSAGSNWNNARGDCYYKPATGKVYPAFGDAGSWVYCEQAAPVTNAIWGCRFSGGCYCVTDSGGLFTKVSTTDWQFGLFGPARFSGSADICKWEASFFSDNSKSQSKRDVIEAQEGGRVEETLPEFSQA